MFIRCKRSEKHSKWHCSGDEKRINNDGRIIKLNMDRLSDGYLEYASESPYSVQNMANIRIRLNFDSSNTLVNRLGPNIDNTFFLST